ncbi:unnamed protein product [Musa hybrid cultivar]
MHNFLISNHGFLFGGGLLGYAIYGCTRYCLHHGQPSKDPAKNLKQYHLNHHFRIQVCIIAEMKCMCRVIKK